MGRSRMVPRPTAVVALACGFAVSLTGCRPEGERFDLVAEVQSDGGVVFLVPLCEGDRFYTLGVNGGREGPGGLFASGGGPWERPGSLRFEISVEAYEAGLFDGALETYYDEPYEHPLERTSDLVHFEVSTPKIKAGAQLDAVDQLAPGLYRVPMVDGVSRWNPISSVDEDAYVAAACGE